MRRITFAAIAVVVLFAASLSGMKPAKATPTFGFPHQYGLVSDLNIVAMSTTCFLPLLPNGLPANGATGGIAVINVEGTFVGSLDVYTSVDGKFDDAAKQGALITAPFAAPVQYALPSGTTAVRVQNRVYTSGDPYVSLDCLGGRVVFPLVVPTPTATP